MAESPKNRRRARYGIGNLIVLITVLALICTIVAFSAGPQSKSSISNLVIRKNLSIINVNGTGYGIALLSSVNNTAIIKLQKLPIIASTPILFEVEEGKAAAINTYQNSSYANVEIKLDAVSGNSAEIDILSVTGMLMPVSTNGAYTTAPTTMATTVTTSMQSTTAATTTINGTKNENETSIAMQDLSKDENYAIMLNYSAYYANAANCTPNLYNQTYLANKGSWPKGYATYWNVTAMSPSALSFSINRTGAGTFNATFTSSINGNKNVAALFSINIATGAVQQRYMGIFAGYTYSKLYAAKVNITAIGSSCGILIV